MRLVLSVALAVSGVIHAYLYVHGYRHIPTVGPAFLWQASVFCALAVLIVVGGPSWLRWAGAAGAIGSLVAFALSRTDNLFGFTEHGWQPSPYAVISVLAEALTVVLVGATALPRRTSSAVSQAPHRQAAHDETGPSVRGR
jgi:hypothetical protein